MPSLQRKLSLYIEIFESRVYQISRRWHPRENYRGLLRTSQCICCLLNSCKLFSDTLLVLSKSVIWFEASTTLILLALFWRLLLNILSNNRLFIYIHLIRPSSLTFYLYRWLISNLVQEIYYHSCSRKVEMRNHWNLPSNYRFSSSNHHLPPLRLHSKNAR